MTTNIIGEIVVYVIIGGDHDTFRYDATEQTDTLTEESGGLVIRNVIYNQKATSVGFAAGVWQFFVMTEKTDFISEAEKIEALEPHAAAVDMVHDIKPVRDNGSNERA